jgi:Arc/MetJ-type ribon-helix-helix transcriptional regulator
MGTVVRMTKAKVTMTMDKDLLARVKQAIDSGRAPSVSAYIEKAVEHWLIEEESAEELVDDMLEESGGPITADERVWADRILR